MMTIYAKFNGELMVFKTDAVNAHAAIWAVRHNLWETTKGVRFPCMVLIK
jgi:hypothetical protein